MAEFLDDQALLESVAVAQNQSGAPDLQHIPSKMLSNFSTPEDRPIIERMFDEKLLPRETGERTKTLIQFIKMFSKDSNYQAFSQLLK